LIAGFLERKAMLSLLTDVTMSRMAPWSAQDVFQVLLWAIELLGRLAPGSADAAVAQELLARCFASLQSRGSAQYSPAACERVAKFVLPVAAMPAVPAAATAASAAPVAQPPLLPDRIALWKRLVSNTTGAIALANMLLGQLRAFCETVGINPAAVLAQDLAGLAQTGIPEAANILAELRPEALVQALLPQVERYVKALQGLALRRQTAGAAGPDRTTVHMLFLLLVSVSPAVGQSVLRGIIAGDIRAFLRRVLECIDYEVATTFSLFVDHAKQPMYQNIYIKIIIFFLLQRLPRDRSRRPCKHSQPRCPD